MSPEPQINACYEPKSGTWQYIVADPTTNDAAIIDPVLDFDAATSSISTSTADKLLDLIARQNYTITHILETHVHADHLTASAYLQTQLLRKGATQRPKICIGKRIKDVQSRFGARYHVDPSELSDAFDYTFSDDETFSIGSLKAQVLHLPGHTPDHIGYAIGPNVFTGDSIFNPDVGSARCDFPGGSANALFGSMSTLLALPAHYRLYTGHDYPPADRPHPNKADGAGDDDGDGGAGREVPFTTVKEQKERNKHVRDGTVREDFVKWRSERDAGLAEPKVIHQALQFNIRGGRVPGPDPEGYRFLRVPLPGAAGGFVDCACVFLVLPLRTYDWVNECSTTMCMTRLYVYMIVHQQNRLYQRISRAPIWRDLASISKVRPSVSTGQKGGPSSAIDVQRTHA